MEQRNNFKNFTRKVGGYLASIDITLFATIVAISLFGIINMYGISGNYNITQKQASVVFIGLCLMIVFSFIKKLLPAGIIFLSISCLSSGINPVFSCYQGS